MLVYICKLPLI